MLARHINIECVFSERIKLPKSKLHTLNLNKKHTQRFKNKEKYKSYLKEIRKLDGLFMQQRRYMVSLFLRKVNLLRI